MKELERMWYSNLIIQELKWDLSINWNFCPIFDWSSTVCFVLRLVTENTHNAKIWGMHMKGTYLVPATLHREGLREGRVFKTIKSKRQKHKASRKCQVTKDYILSGTMLIQSSSGSQAKKHILIDEGKDTAWDVQTMGIIEVHHFKNLILK